MPVRNAQKISKLLPIYHGVSSAQEFLGSDYARAAELARVTKTATSLIDGLAQEIEAAADSQQQYWQVKTWRELRK